MIPYIIHVAILLAGCYVFYQLLLKNETFFQLNRWLLVGCVTLSFLAPLYEIPENWSLRTGEPITAFTPKDEAIKPIIPSKIELIDPKIPAFEQEQEKEKTIAETKETVTIAPTFSVKNISWQLVLWSIYVIGLGIFAINFLLQLGILLYNIFKYPSIQDGRFKIVELTKDKPPYSFLNYIFINPTQYDWDTYNQILEHEKIHIEERHTFDILLSELVVVLQWFNPFAWWYRKVVENNLEYLTDQKMLQKGTNRESYQMNLLKISVPEFPLNMTMNYNQSFLKKRIIMMDTKKSSARSTWKYLFLLPLFGISLISLNTVKPIPTIPALLPTHTIDNGRELPTSGQWKGDIMDNIVCLTFDNSDSRKAIRWHVDECFAKANFSELPTTGKTFEVKRAAGTLQLTGKFTGKEGKGSFKFIGNKDFKANLITRFEEKEVTTSDLFHCFFADINADYMAYLEFGDFKLSI